MTKLLERMVARAAAMSETQQDEFAKLMMHELEGEAAWQASFDRTTDNQWRKMAERVCEQISNGQIKPFDPAAL